MILVTILLNAEASLSLSLSLHTHTHSAQLKAVGFKVEDLKVNGKDYNVKNRNDNVKTMELGHSSGTLHFNFPQDYNVGTTANADATGEKMMTLTSGKTVKIKVHSPDLEKQEVTIDYLFETASLTNGKYFVYDPTIHEVHSKDSKDFDSSADVSEDAASDVLPSVTLTVIVSVLAVLFL